MPPHILIVDDDAAIRATLTEVLMEEGYTVEAVIHGIEGLEAVTRTSPALVLLDMRMPVLDGWGFAGALREYGVDVPIVVMTAAQEAHQWAAEINAAAVLAKPFDLDELIHVIEHVLVRQH